MPIPGLLWAAPVSGGSEFAVVPVLAYGFGVAVATLVAQSHIEQVLCECGLEHPWRAASVSLALMAVFALLWCRGTSSADVALQAVADSVLSACSAAVLLPLALTWLHFDEAFVARANRVRERRARFFEWVAQITVPRWAFSFTGIAVVVLALGWDGGGAGIPGGLGLRAVTVGTLIVAAAAVSGGWREGLAIGLVASTACLIALWATVVDSRAQFGAVGVLQVASLGMFFALYSGRHARAWRRKNEPPVIAERRSVERGGGQAFAGLCAVVVVLPAVAVWTGNLVFVIGVFVAGAAAMLFVPAVSTALEVLIPRRRSVEELYGRRKKPLSR